MPGGRLELPCLAALDLKSSAYTIPPPRLHLFYHEEYGGPGGTRSRLLCASARSAATPPRGAGRPRSSRNAPAFASRRNARTRVSPVPKENTPCFLEARAGLEPAHSGFADRRVTPSPPSHSLPIACPPSFRRRRGYRAMES